MSSGIDTRGIQETIALFKSSLPSSLGGRKVNFEGTQTRDFFIHLFPEDLIDDIVQSTNMYALQKSSDENFSHCPICFIQTNICITSSELLS